MAGIHDNIAIIGDWTPTNPSPRLFFSNFFDDDFSSKLVSDFPSESGSKGSLSESEKQDVLLLDSNSESNVFGTAKPGSRGGLAERMAARAGFHAPKINTAHVRSAEFCSSSPGVRSPYITISPGLSPTVLLDPPIFLSNSLAQPSPTTGKFLLGNCADADSEHFVFKPLLESSSSYFSNPIDKVDLTSTQQECCNQDGSIDPGVIPSLNDLQSNFSGPSDRQGSSGEFTFDQKTCSFVTGQEGLHPPGSQHEDEEQKGNFSSTGSGQPSEDGYNWRKYGQKQVKGSEYPRSYYKCTHQNCEVKKKVARSHEDHITEIIYKGGHNHPKPLPSCQAELMSLLPFGGILQINGSQNQCLRASVDGRTKWSSARNGSVGQDWMECLEESSSASVVGAAHIKDGPRFESIDAIDVSSTLSNDEEVDQATHGSVSLGGGDGEEDESESKRRKLDPSAMDMNLNSRAGHEPRVVVQTTSEVDILDDGYRWRKYGQKVVKGNPNPRSYYKCTSAGCNVRKHVERAPHDLMSVITTYEGKHNHDVPTARNSSHASGGPAAASSAKSHGINRRPEPCRAQDGLPGLELDASSGLEKLGLLTGLSFGLGQADLANLAMAGLGPAAMMKMLAPVHSYLGPNPLNVAGLIIPKGEPCEESMLETGLPIRKAASAYQRIISRLPSGPQM